MSLSFARNGPGYLANGWKKSRYTTRETVLLHNLVSYSWQPIIGWQALPAVDMPIKGLTHIAMPKMEKRARSLIEPTAVWARKLSIDMLKISGFGQSKTMMVLRSKKTWIAKTHLYNSTTDNFGLYNLSERQMGFGQKEISESK